MAAVRFFGPIGDRTGYGNAVKNFALAFSKSDIPTKFVFGKDAEKRYGSFLNDLNHYGGRTRIDFYLHGPPWNKHKSMAAYRIAYFYWEADRLPVSWERSINSVDELWVPCELVKKACLRARFKGRIKVIPTPCDPWEHEDVVSIPSHSFEDFVVSDKVLKFYSIFQWHERKGYKELLSAYYKSFGPHDNVLLLLKVNPLNIAGNTRSTIMSDISLLKRKLNQKYYPPVFLMRDIISTEKIQAIHNTCDIYVAPHHGEGWGMPIHDAMLAGNQIITTRFGGVTDFLNNSSAHIINHSMGPVTNMGWSPLYNKTQNWAYPSYNHLSKIMKEVYNNPERFSNKAEKAKIIAESMTTDEVAKMINREIGRIHVR